MLIKKHQHGTTNAIRTDLQEVTIWYPKCIAFGNSSLCSLSISSACVYFSPTCHVEGRLNVGPCLLRPNQTIKPKRLSQCVFAVLPLTLRDTKSRLFPNQYITRGR
eukprot:4077626-Amphidinium_carterae.1